VKQQHPFHHSICTKNSLIRTTHHSDKELYVELKELQEELMMAGVLHVYIHFTFFPFLSPKQNLHSS
jgi:hypothetical protein